MLDIFITYLIPTSTFLLSIFAFFFTLTEFLKKRAKIKLDIIRKDELMELVPDRQSYTEPDVLWHFPRRLFPNVVISNLSSNPITVLDIVINDTISFEKYHDLYAPEYIATTQTDRFKVNGGFLINGDGTKQTGMRIEGKVLDSIFTIPPYTSISGVLFFAYDKSLLGENKATIKTSTKDFNFKLTVSKECVSVLKAFEPLQ